MGNGTDFKNEEERWLADLKIEEARREDDFKIEEARRTHQRSVEFHTLVNKSAHDTAILTLRTLILINGGAAVAVLAFLGSVAAKDRVDLSNIGAVASTMLYFACGVALAMAAIAFVYLTALSWQRRNRQRLGEWSIPI